jgi:hypothetical protein
MRKRKKLSGRTLKQQAIKKITHAEWVIALNVDCLDALEHISHIRGFNFIQGQGLCKIARQLRSWEKTAYVMKVHSISWTYSIF